MRNPIAFTIFLAISVLPAAARARDASPERAIILFGANWCAPCVGELRDLPELAGAAAPDRLVIAWTDGAVRIPAKVAEAGVEQLPRDKAVELMARYGAGNAGLPLVVMIDGDGTRCAMQRRRLTRDGVIAMRKECDSGSSRETASAEYDLESAGPAV